MGRLRAGPERALVDDWLGRFDRAGRPLGLGPASVHEVEAPGGPGPEGLALLRQVPQGATVLALDEPEARRLLPSAPAADALLAAARHGRLSALELGLALGLPIDGRDAHGLTALHEAARNGHLALVKALVAHGASLELRDPMYGGTPLGHARHFTARWPRPDGAAVIAFLEQLDNE